MMFEETDLTNVHFAHYFSLLSVKIFAFNISGFVGIVKCMLGICLGRVGDVVGVHLTR